MAMKGIMIHYNLHRLEALEQALSKQGLELDMVLAPSLERLYEQYVPAPVRGGIEMKVREDELRDTGEKRSSITLLCCTERGREHYLMETSSVLDGFYKTAGHFKNYFEHPARWLGPAYFTYACKLQKHIPTMTSEGIDRNNMRLYMNAGVDVVMADDCLYTKEQLAKREWCTIAETTRNFMNTVVRR